MQYQMPAQQIPASPQSMILSKRQIFRWRFSIWLCILIKITPFPQRHKCSINIRIKANKRRTCCTWSNNSKSRSSFWRTSSTRISTIKTSETTKWRRLKTFHFRALLLQKTAVGTKILLLESNCRIIFPVCGRFRAHQPVQIVRKRRNRRCENCCRLLKEARNYMSADLPLSCSPGQNWKPFLLSNFTSREEKVSRSEACSSVTNETDGMCTILSRVDELLKQVLMRKNNFQKSSRSKLQTKIEKWTFLAHSDHSLLR